MSFCFTQSTQIKMHNKSDEEDNSTMLVDNSFDPDQNKSIFDLQMVEICIVEKNSAKEINNTIQKMLHFSHQTKLFMIISRNFQNKKT